MDRNKYLDEAIKIGNEILERTEKTEHGYAWKTMVSLGGADVDWQFSEALYSGVAGIVYYFLELHKRTNDKRHLEAISEGAKWLENYCADNKTDYYAFYTGRMGVSYLMLQLADYFKDDSYKTKALKIAEGCESFLRTDRKIDDLINGSSGTLLGLLHLHAATGDSNVLDKIEKYTEHLINRANVTPYGFYWDRSGTNITGLCGFSHGAAGIGYVFLELGRYFDNDTFYWIAERAFSYENHCFRDEFNNWPDFRRGFYDEKTLNENRDKYLNGQKEFFLTPSDMSAWCHGAPGIGLSRVRAYELLKKGRYKSDLVKAIAKTEDVTLSPDLSYEGSVLCHGRGGNAILFLEAARVLGEPKYEELAIRNADVALNYKQKSGGYLSGYAQAGRKNDISLFMGDAGIGYFYLLVSDQMQEEPTILKPDIKQVSKEKPQGILTIELEELFRKLASNLYPLTYEKVKEDIDLKALTDIGDGSFMLLLKKALEEIIVAKNNVRVQHLWAYECKKEELDGAMESHSYNRIRRIVEIEKNQACLRKAELINAELVLPEEHVLLELPEEIIAKNSEEGDYAIFVPTAESLLEFPLNDFAYSVISKFETPKNVEQVISEMVEEFDVTDHAEVAQVRAVTLNQISEALAQGILYTSSSEMVEN